MPNALSKISIGYKDHSVQRKQILSKRCLSNNQLVINKCGTNVTL